MKRKIYMDNGATSFPKAPGVGEAMCRYINEIGANVNRSTYDSASTAAMTVLNTREKLMELFNFPGKETEVIFTPGQTYALNQIIRGALKKGDHIIVSSMEHNAVMRPIIETGVEFSRIPADSEGCTKPEDIIPLFKENTKLVLVNHASNVSGTVFPLEEIAEICYKRNIPLALDAAQTAGHRNIDFEALHLSALAVPGHKGLLGPQGIGALLLDRDFAKKLAPLTSGGTGSASDSEHQPQFMPDRFESGTMNIPGIYGLNASLEFILKTGTENIKKHEKELTRCFIEGLKGLPIRVVGPCDEEKQVGVVSIDFTDNDNGDIAYRLERDYGILTRCGLHCAPNAHKTLGTFPQGTVRFSFGYATTGEEIDYTIDAIRSVV